MEWGPHLDRLRPENRARVLARRPALAADLGSIWQAFLVLSRGRGHGRGGPLPIGFEALERYAARFGPNDADDFEDFLELIWEMDRAFLEWAAQRRGRRR